VQVAPELNKITVFKNGISQALNGSIPIGGQTDPSSGVGATLEWKKSPKESKEEHYLRYNK
jgi:hypothetical protein